jgi:hypothetical protein
MSHLRSCFAEDSSIALHLEHFGKKVGTGRKSRGERLILVNKREDVWIKKRRDRARRVYILEPVSNTKAVSAASGQHSSRKQAFSYS